MSNELIQWYKQKGVINIGFESEDDMYDEDYNYIVGDKPGVILGYKVNTIKDIDFCGRPQFIKRAKQYIIFYNSNEVLYEKDFNRYKNIVRKINKSK